MRELEAVIRSAILKPFTEEDDDNRDTIRELLNSAPPPSTEPPKATTPDTLAGDEPAAQTWDIKDLAFLEI